MLTALGLGPLSGCASESRDQPRTAGIALADCQLNAPGGLARRSADCGTLSVNEDRRRPDGRKIDLRFAVVSSVSRNPRPDPLFFLTGGPGQAATESFVVLHPAFAGINKTRDIVLLDQRGTGGSNPLRCPQDEELVDLSLAKGKEIEAFVARCLEELGTTDTRLYLTSAAVEDLDELRERLGYERINLYGVSYGTRVALAYLKRFPDRVRSVVLDGVVPADEVLGIGVGRDAQRALDLIFSRCESDPTCRKRFPELSRSLDRLFERLERPVTLEILHPRTADKETVRFDRDSAAFVIRFLSYSPETVSLIPLLVTTAAEGDMGPLASQFLLITSQLEESISNGMGYSILCSEDFPFFDEAENPADDRDSYLGSLQTDSLRTLCPLWPRGELDDGFKQPVASDVPVLLLSGEADPVTPPEKAEAAARTLTNSLLLVAPGQGHNVVYRGCIQTIVAEFLRTASLEGVEADCVQKIAPPAFFTSFSGPTS